MAAPTAVPSSIQPSPTNLAKLAPITSAITALSNLILVSPQSTVGYQPLSAANVNGALDTFQGQPPALIFNYEGEQTATLESDITDHYTENNTALQDQIALRPVIITTKGFIGELNDVIPFGLQTLQAAANKLTTIGAYAPGLSATAQLAFDEAFLIYQTGANALNSLVSSVNGLINTVTGNNGQNDIGSNGMISLSSTQNAQQSQFSAFFGYWNSKTLFNVQTPWAVFQNMAIQKLRAIQDSETNVITDFEISFKQILTASTQTSSGGLAQLASGNLGAQQSPVQNTGPQAGGPSTTFTPA